MSKKYAGIGSRKTPGFTLYKMTGLASILEKIGYHLVSGGAPRADRAFENGISNPDNKTIYGPGDCEQWCLEMVKKYIPTNRPPLEEMSWQAQRLIGRNMKIILGDDGISPVEFVLFWAPYLPPDDPVGGTGYGIRCALDHGIQVYNLLSNEDEERFRENVLHKD